MRSSRDGRDSEGPLGASVLLAVLAAWQLADTTRALAAPHVVHDVHHARDEGGSATPESGSDALFAARGSWSASAATGIPYVGIAEAAYAFTDTFTLGALAGITPRVWGVGLRPRYAFFESATMRAFLVAPTFYYPVTHGPAAEPWVLSYPSVRFELVSQSRARVHAGAGLIAAACVNELVGDHDDHDAQHAHHEAVQAGEPMFGIWNTLLIGGSLPLSDHHHLYAEASVVLAGLELAPSTWIGGPPPLVLQVGASWTF